MKILTCVSDAQWLSLSSLKGATWLRVQQPEEWKNHAIPDAIFLGAETPIHDIPETVPVFMDAAHIASTPHAQVNYISLWPGLIERPRWEVGGNSNEKANHILQSLNISPVWITPATGLIAARVVSMIINEAYFALEAGISTKDEIDIAMKLGTGYPYGPFEWSRKIGISRIAELLLHLSPTDTRYQPCALLLKEANV